MSKCIVHQYTEQALSYNHNGLESNRIFCNCLRKIFYFLPKAWII